MTSYTILLVEDNPGDARLVRDMLAGETRTPVQLRDAQTLREAHERLEGEAFDAVVLDLGLPDSRGIDTFIALHHRFSQVPIVVLTGTNDTELAAAAVHAGAEDYLVKGTLDGPALARSLRYAIERRKATEALRRSEATLRGFYENAPLLMGVVELSEDDQIVHVHDNPRTARFFARRGEGTAGVGARDLGAPEEAVRIWAANYRLAEREARPVSFEYRHPGDGNEIWLSVHVAPIGRGPSGRMQFCYVAEDVTERNRSDAEIRQHADELARSNADLRRFNRLSIGRELRMVELKKEVDALRRECGKPPRYTIDDATGEATDFGRGETEVPE